MSEKRIVSEVVSQPDTIILIGLGGLGSYVFQALLRHLKYLYYLREQGALPSSYRVGVYVFDGDRLSEESNAVKTGFDFTPEPSEGWESVLGRKKKDLAIDLVLAFRYQHISSILKDETINFAGYFGDADAEFFAKNRKQFGRILLIDASDKKRFLYPKYEMFLRKDDDYIAVGYDYGTDKGLYGTIYINPLQDAVETFQDVYESIPLSPHLGSLVADMLLLILSHLPYHDYKDVDITIDFRKFLGDLITESGIRRKKEKVAVSMPAMVESSWWKGCMRMLKETE